MKRLIAVLIIVVALIASATVEQVYFTKTLAELRVKTEEIEQLLNLDQENIDTTQNIEKASALNAYWDKHKHYFQMLLSHVYVSDLEYKIVALEPHIRQNDYNMADTDISQILGCCDILVELTTPHVHTIL